MARHTAIAEVGETLVGLLRDQLGPLVSNDDEVALASPESVDAGDEIRLTLYLYRVTENGELRNQRHETPANGHGSVRPAPLALDLYYLLTAHPSVGTGDETDRTRTQHLVLGRAVQVLAENAVLRATDLYPTSLAEDRELHLSVYPEPMEEVTSIWNTFPDKPFEPSVAYVVGPVLVDATGDEPVDRVEAVERRYRSYDLAPGDARPVGDAGADGDAGGAGDANGGGP